ncbi:MAG: xanthine dehydrogenase family protein molybdopterin-binding subunit [Minwuia sp.]|uniref:xanthine dehydrogenase family protein molybdopterin-binding subunit n=1 Tax=Minwuia sp. TaxID=2493630 RepID=UPI003A8B5919
MTIQTGIGASVRRKEDLRFLTGRGNYVADHSLPHMTRGMFLRSPHAHATIDSIDISGALAVEGVIAVYTGEDMQAAEVGGLPCAWPVTGKGGVPTIEPMHPVLAVGKVRHVGDPVAIVVAETLEAATAGAEAIEVEYGVLEPAVGMLEALAPGAPVVHDDAPGNLCFDWEVGDAAAVDAAFEKAAHVAHLSLVNNRLAGNPMEPRACIGDYNTGTGQFTMWTTSQFPHIVKLLMGNFVLGIPQHKLRVISPDVGGGFGVKQFHYAEEAAVTYAAKQLGRPVKWVCERTEAFISDAHGRDHISEAELALDEKGTFLGLRVKTIANMGGYLSTFGPNIPTNLYGLLLAGVYTTPAIYCEVKGVFTNTQPVDAYRGAGRPEATFLLERLVDVAADDMGLSKVDIRRRNFIPKDAYPYQTPVMVNYDSGDHEGCLDQALASADWDGFEARKAESARNGKLRGIGLCTYIEACGLAPSRIAGALGVRGGLFESATVRVHPTGDITVLMGTHNHGQGHETTFAQIVSERFGLPTDKIEIVFGDTDKIQFGLGTYGSRSLAVGGPALVRSTEKVIEKGKKIAAHMLEADASDIVFENATFSVAGTDRKKDFAEIALAAHMPHDYPLEVLEPGLEEQSFYDPVNFTYPGGAHIAEVEIDPETGIVDLLSYVAVDDIGTVINPMIVKGQLHGGIVQGVGQALFENCVYDEESGQILSGSFMDYCMPRADRLPNMVVETHSTFCTHNGLGVKGCGEVGTIGSPATVINAVVDALSHLGVTHVDMPASPSRVWRIINEAASRQAAE